MLRIDQLRLHPGQQETLLRARCAKLLRVAPADITACTVLRKAIDAREDLTLVYTVSVSVKNEAQVLRRCRDKRISVYKQEVYFLPPLVTAPAVRPIVVGAGPAGLFAALVLARCGARPILLERGRPVEHRQVDVERFWSGGPLDPDSNVQFGEGGAGAFSDGKLNTGTKDLRHRFILETLVRCGAPDTIDRCQAPRGHRQAPHRPAGPAAGAGGGRGGHTLQRPAGAYTDTGRRGQRRRRLPERADL